MCFQRFLTGEGKLQLAAITQVNPRPVLLLTELQALFY